MQRLVSQLNKLAFPDIITNFPGNEKKIYLTFDDGPTPGITNQVLALLSGYQARATFFCRGDQVRSYPEIFHKTEEGGHTTGNHGYSHLHGWYSPKANYVYDCMKAAEVIPNRIFRPPYGKITPWEYRFLKKEFTLYLWTALTWDFHPRVSPAMCLKIAFRYLHPGNILVFHDTEKASRKLFYALPRILEAGMEKGLEFVAIPPVTRG
jgi:peptidoglycan/xylan/chitin deacetylase (PgdA/CDA1 family)